MCVGGKEQVFSFTLPLDDANIDQALFGPPSRVHGAIYIVSPGGRVCFSPQFQMTCVSVSDLFVSFSVCCGLKHFR